VAPLAQLNLKLPPAVLADWRRRAREAGHGDSVRDWLLATLAPAAAPPAGPAGGAELADRVAQLEAATAELREALAQPRRSPERVNPSITQTGEQPSPDRVEPLRVPLGRGQLEIIGANHFRPPQPSPERVPPAHPSGGAPITRAGGLPAGEIETAALADLLGIRRGTLNARIARAGGPAAGLVIDGWRCVGLRTPERGGPARALWVPAEY